MFRTLVIRNFCRDIVTSKANRFVNVTPFKFSSPLCIQSASIYSKETRDPNYKRPAPWPYKEKKYTGFHSYFKLDNTTDRFDENTQLIVVEGNIAVGKSSFAKHLADQLDMIYVPEPDLSEIYFLENGFDLRTLKPLLPKHYQPFSVQDFYANPHDPNTGLLQMDLYRLRLEQYLEALAHLLNTGQGIVMDRSVYSDIVFLEAMRRAGYVNDNVKSYYDEMREATLHEIELKPTIVIYLDCPAEICLERIKKRNIDFEKNSKVLTKEYLENIEDVYKHCVLPEIKVHSEVLVYDWSDYGDPEAVVEDLERLDFGKYDRYDKKTLNWRQERRVFWEEWRLKYSNERFEILTYTFLSRYDVPEILPTVEMNVERDKVLQELANFKYEKGYNPYLGDSYFFKNTKKNYWDEQKYKLEILWRPQ